jgi:hypothetical protein
MRHIVYLPPVWLLQGGNYYDKKISLAIAYYIGYLSIPDKLILLGNKYFETFHTQKTS